jgi:tetratricopeptide (TPR) repeat protein
MAAIIDQQLIPRLPADVLAQFESVSGLLIVNVTQRELSVAAGRPADDGSMEVFAAINHETFHYFQVIGTGYCYAHMARMRRLVEDILRQDRLRERRAAPRRFGMRVADRLVGRSELGERTLGHLALLDELNDLSRLQAAATTEDPSLVAAKAPALLAALEEHAARLRAPAGEGLCVLDLIECGALVYQYALTYAGSDWRERLTADWPHFDETYRRAYEVAERHCGARALDVLLPALALALRYEQPAGAYGEVLTHVARAAPGAELAAARDLARHPLEVPAAGRHLGTAADVRGRRRFGAGRDKVYDGVLREVQRRTWGVDELDLLANPQAANNVPSFPLGLLTSDGEIVGLSGADLNARVRLARIILKTESFQRLARDTDQRTRDHFRRGAHFLFGPFTPATRAFQRGVRRTEEGRIEDACEAFREALDPSEPKTAQLAAYNLGILYRDQGKGSEAREYLARAARAGDTGIAAQAAFNLGVVLADAGDAEGAIDAYQDAVRSGDEEDAPRAADNLGNLLAGRGDIEGARAAYQAAIDFAHPTYSRTALYNLGLLLAHEGDLEGARSALEEVVRSRHRQVAPHAALNLGLLLLQQGEVQEGAKALRRAAASGDAEIVRRVAEITAALADME